MSDYVEISEEEFNALNNIPGQANAGNQFSFQSTPEKPRDNVYSAMEQSRKEMSERDFFNYADPEKRDFIDKDINLGTYGVGDVVYDMVIDPTLFLTGATSDVANGLLLGLDRMAVATDNYFRSKRGDPSAQKGDSIFGDIAKATKMYHMGDMVREINQQVEAVRGIADPEDRLENAKRIAGEYGAFFVHLFGGIEAAKMIPGLRGIAKKIDPILRKAILKNPTATLAVEGTGVLAETEVVAQGGSEIDQAIAGGGTTLAVPAVYNANKKRLFKRAASKAAREYFEKMGYRNFAGAAELLQRVTDPEKSAEYLQTVMKEGNLPPDVRAPLQLLLGDDGFTYLETVLNNSKEGINMSVRDKEFLQGLNKLIEPVSKGKVTTAEQWFRLSEQMFEKDLKASTYKIAETGLDKLKEITQNLPGPDEIAQASYESLLESKSIFGKYVNDAWELTDLDKELPGTARFLDFKRIFRAPNIDVNAKNINEVINRFDVEKGFESIIKKLDEDFLIRLNTDDIVANEDELRQALIEATGGSERVLDKFDNFLRQVKDHRDVRIRGGVPTGNAFSNPEAMRRAYGDKYLVDVAEEVNVPYESETMKTLEELARKHGIGSLPLSAQEVLNGDVKIRTIGDLYDLRQRLGREGMGNISNGQVKQNAYFSNTIRTAILEDLAELPDDGNLSLKRAIAFSRDYNLTFKSGAVGKILAIENDGTTIDPTQALFSIFKTGGVNFNRTGRINTQQILNATKQFSLTDTGNISKVRNGSFEQLLQDYMVNLYVNGRGVVKDGILVPGKGQDFYNQYQAILDMPEMIRAKETILNASGDVSVIKKMLDNNVSLAKVKAGFYGKESLGAVQLFLGDDITGGITKMMMSKGGIEQLKELRRLVMSKEVPDKFFTKLGISRSLVLEGVKDSIRLGLINIGSQGESATSYSLLKQLLQPGRKGVAEGELIPFLREAGFNSKEINNFRKFSNELDKYAKYLTTEKSKANQVANYKDMDNMLYNIIGLFLGGVGADFFRSGSSLAAATYIKTQTKNTLQRLDGNQAVQIINDAMSDPKLLDELLRTPSHFNKDQLIKSRPYLFKYLAGRGLENFGAPSDKEIAAKMDQLQVSDIKLPSELLFEQELQNGIERSIVDTIYEPYEPKLESLQTGPSQEQIDLRMQEMEALINSMPENQGMN